MKDLVDRYTDVVNAGPKYDSQPSPAGPFPESDQLAIVVKFNSVGLPEAPALAVLPCVWAR